MSIIHVALVFLTGDSLVGENIVEFRVKNKNSLYRLHDIS